MADKLIVENFGPIRKAELEVKDMMVFIGAQSSGKSTLAKLITILSDFNFRQNYTSQFKEELSKYNLKSFLKKSTYISYESTFFRFTYKNNKEDKFDYSRILNYNLNKKKHTEEEIEFISLILGIMIFIIVKDGKSDILTRELQKDAFFGFIDTPESLTTFKINNRDSFNKITYNILQAYRKKIELVSLKELAKQVGRVFSFIRPLDSLYIPAERTLIPLLQNNIAGILQGNVLFPDYVLQTIQEYVIALKTVENLDLKIIGNLRYKNVEDKYYIYHNRNQKINLREASSGVQSLLPILMLIEASVKKEKYINLNYVVEEPELNLYPEAQYNLVKYLVKQCLETDFKVQSKNLIITTHSPYILASINNLLYAYTIGDKKPEETKKIIAKRSWICHKNFNAYQVINGTVEQIYDKKEKLIDSNIIDESSEIIMEDFNSLAQIDG